MNPIRVLRMQKWIKRKYAKTLRSKGLKDLDGKNWGLACDL